MLAAVRVAGIDERNLVDEGHATNFVVFIYEGDATAHASWSVDGLLFTDTGVPQVLGWLRQKLPLDSCWSLGVVLDPPVPTAVSDLSVRWIVGADVLNMSPQERSPGEQRLVEEMLGRRHRVELA